jgi:hypothetical protein
MFSSQKDNSVLESRITALEQQNASLIQELRNMCAHYNHHIERLERRITDYTDVWHPMMTANMTRIKTEVVEETKTHINEISQQIQAEQNAKPLSSIQQIDPLAGYVVVGFDYVYEKGKRSVKPVFANRCHSKHDFGLTCVIRGITAFIVDSIASFPQIKHFDLVDFRSGTTPDSLNTPEMIDIDGNVLCSSLKGKPKYSQVEKLDQAFAKYGVELLYEGKPITN